MKRFVCVLGISLALVSPIPFVQAQESGPVPQKKTKVGKAENAKDKKGKSKKGKGKRGRDTGKAKEPGPKFRFTNGDHPSLRFGDWGRADFRMKFQHDLQTFSPDLNGDEAEVATLARWRFAVEGYVTRDLEYTVEREVRNEALDLLGLRTNTTNLVWRDAWVNYRKFRRFQLRVGQQKMPFGRDQINGMTGSEFVYRSLGGQALAPGVEFGAVLHGKPWSGKISYELGFFKNDGYRASNSGERTGTRTFVGRVVVPPFEYFSRRSLKPLKNIQLGFAFTESPLPTSKGGLRGVTWAPGSSYFDRLWVRGHRLRLGSEFDWETGPFSLRGEAIRVRDQRLEQGAGGVDLPNLLYHSWYAGGSMLLTGEKKSSMKIQRPLEWNRLGTGAIELAGRLEQIRFSSDTSSGTPGRGSRAANVLASSERATTLGVNWYLNKRMRISFDAVREKLEDPRTALIRDRTVYWGRYVRIQFVL